MTDVRRESEPGAPRRRFGPRPAGQAAIAVAVALLGFLLAIQLRSQEDLADRLAIEREADLGQLLSQLTSRSDQLLADIVDLQARLSQSTGSAEQAKALLESARAELGSLQVLLGIVPVEGEGIVMTLEDPEHTLGPDVLLDIVQELRDAGAEAIDISGLRVVARTAFTGHSGDLAVGGTRVSAPYVIKAIGASPTLAEAMRIPGGVVDAITSLPGASVRIEERSSVSILSVAPAPTFSYAQPQPRR
ncbi:MAG TPA: DUF881 domain-containing protein [Actinomycetota bacterium]